jgi:hypothetical protein
LVEFRFVCLDNPYHPPKSTVRFLHLRDNPATEFFSASRLVVESPEFRIEIVNILGQVSVGYFSKSSPSSVYDCRSVGHSER